MRLTQHRRRPPRITARERLTTLVRIRVQREHRDEHPRPAFAGGDRTRAHTRLEFAIGDPAVALPGTRVRMPLSLLTIRGLGPAVLRSPSPRSVYRRLLAQGLGHAEVAAAPAGLLEALRLSGRRPQNARTIADALGPAGEQRRRR